MKNNPKLAGRLQVALVRINQAYHESKLREVGIDASARFSQYADAARRAQGFLERFVSDERITDPDIAKWVGKKAPATKKADTEAPERAEYDKTWARLCETFESRAREYLRTHPAGPGERPGVVFERALASAFADTGDLDPQTVASLRTAIAEEYWYRRKQGTLASSATADAMTGRVSREEFVRRAEAVAALATEHYVSGLSAEESLAIVASPQYLSAVRALAPQTSTPSAPGASSLGYPSAPDGSLVVRTADSSIDYRLDPSTGIISSPEGLSLSVRAGAERDAVERAVSSLDFLRASGLAFLGSDVSRVFELAHRLDPAASLRPEDGLDKSERHRLLSVLLPFFGVELPDGAIYTDMTAALDRINHGTSDAQSGLLLRLAERGVGYIDSDSLAFDFRAFDTAFAAWTKERFDSAPVSI